MVIADNRRRMVLADNRRRMASPINGGGMDLISCAIGRWRKGSSQIAGMTETRCYRLAASFAA
jgi:hypothetical protein